MCLRTSGKGYILGVDKQTKKKFSNKRLLFVYSCILGAQKSDEAKIWELVRYFKLSIDMDTNHDAHYCIWATYITVMILFCESIWGSTSCLFCQHQNQHFIDQRLVMSCAVFSSFAQIFFFYLAVRHVISHPQIHCKIKSTFEFPFPSIVEKVNKYSFI